MKQILVKLPFSFFLFFASISLASGQTSNRGAIEFEKKEHDFGEILEGSKPKYTFVFKNIGTAPLTVTRVEPACGCTASNWTKTPVAVGETGNIEIEFNSAHYAGLFRKAITIKTDGTPEQVILLFTGTAKPQNIQNGIAQGNLVFSTEIGQLGAVELNKAGKFTFYVQNIGTRPIRLTKGSSEDARIQIKLPTQPIFGKEVSKIEVEVNAETFKAGDLIDLPFVIETNDTIAPKKSLRVNGVAVTPWQ